MYDAFIHYNYVIVPLLFPFTVAYTLLFINSRDLLLFVLVIFGLQQQKIYPTYERINRLSKDG